VGSIYGLMLTAWGAAGVVGPTLIAQVRQATGHYQGALTILAIVTLLSAIVPMLLRPPAVRREIVERETDFGVGRRKAS